MYIKFEKKFELDKKDIINPVVLIGWPGIALVAKLAITPIQESLSAKEFLK
jgi:proteasome assembly chaperone (PAC2) family protein